MSEYSRAQEIASRLGLFGVENALERKLLKTGNSLVVTIDPALAKAVLGTNKPGARLRVGRLGSRIVIEPMRD